MTEQVGPGTVVDGERDLERIESRPQGSPPGGQLVNFLFYLGRGCAALGAPDRERERADCQHDENSSSRHAEIRRAGSRTGCRLCRPPLRTAAQQPQNTNL